MKKKKIYYIILLSIMIINVSQLANFNSDGIIQIMGITHGVGKL
ncbi:hypothetical protein PAEAM_26250 [Paenibacillus sp. GM1FR]|nr:hypothetical protein PAEAM_26250 [Paenibacillus sp. GM1FR]